MKTSTKGRKQSTPIPPVPQGGQLEPTNPQNPKPTDAPTEEPSPWRTTGRLLHEAAFILFFIGAHWLMKKWLTESGQEHEWWAQYLLTVSILYAIIAFTVIFGSELAVDCKRALEYAWKHLRNK